MDTEYTRGFKAGYDFGYKDAANENRYNTGVKVGIAYEQDRIVELIKSNSQCKCGSISEHSKRLIDLLKGKE
jgi:hypothetical protein